MFLTYLSPRRLIQKLTKNYPTMCVPFINKKAPRLVRLFFYSYIITNITKLGHTCYSQSLANLLRNPRLAPNPKAIPAICRLPK